MKKIISFIFVLLMIISATVFVKAEEGRGTVLDDMEYRIVLGTTMADLTKEMNDETSGSGQTVVTLEGNEFTYFDKLAIIDNFRIDDSEITDGDIHHTEIGFIGDYKNQKNTEVSKLSIYLKKQGNDYTVTSDLSEETIELNCDPNTNPYNAHTLVYGFDSDGKNNGNVQISAWVEVYSNGVLQGTITIDKERLNAYNNDPNEKGVVITGFSEYRSDLTSAILSGRGESEATLNELVDVSTVKEAIELAKDGDLIQLTSDIENIVIDKDIVLDINGYNVGKIEGNSAFTLTDSRSSGEVEEVSMQSGYKVILHNIDPAIIDASSVNLENEPNIIERGDYTTEKWRISVSDDEYKKINDIFDRILRMINDKTPYSNDLAKYIDENTYNKIAEYSDEWEIRCSVESSSKFDEDDDRKIKDRYDNKVLHTTDISIYIKALYKKDQQVASGDDTFIIGKMYSVDEPFEIEIEVPKEERHNDRKFSIIRVHDDDIEIVSNDITCDKDGMLHFMSDRFSTYAVAYDIGNENTGNDTDKGSDTSKPSSESKPEKVYDPYDTNKDGVVTCEEKYGEDWYWDEKAKACLVKGYSGIIVDTATK